jgi:hypothetical protein
MVCDGHMFGPSFTGPLLDMLGEWLVQQAGSKDIVILQLGWSTITLCLALAWLPERDLSRAVDWKRFGSFILTCSLRLAPRYSWSDNTRQCSLGIQQNAVLHNRSVTGSCRKSSLAWSRIICQNMAQNSTVLWQWRCPYRYSELLSHEVHTHIKHSTITATVSKKRGGMPTSQPPCISRYTWMLSMALCCLAVLWVTFVSKVMPLPSLKVKIACWLFSPVTMIILMAVNGHFGKDWCRMCCWEASVLHNCRFSFSLQFKPEW